MQVRCWFVLIVILSSSSAQSAILQDLPKTVTKDGGLKLVTVGERVLSSGRHGAFRVYAAPDGTEGEVTYVRFDSTRAAERQEAQWLKLAKQITRKEHKKDRDGQVIGDRILAVGRAKSDSEEFLIIRRNGLNCYLIQSNSFAVAEQVERMIKDSDASGR